MSKKGFWLKSKTANIFAVVLLVVLVAPAIPHFLEVGQTDVTAEPVVASQQVVEPVVEDKQSTPKLWSIDELLATTNEIRTENGVRPLELDANLNRSADMKLLTMTQEDEFEHSDKNGKHGYTYIADTTDYCVSGSENIFRRYPKDSLIRNFESSKPHWDAVNNPDYEAVGFAVNSQYFVMHFCDKD